MRPSSCATCGSYHLTNSSGISTSTRNFPNRLGNQADVYLASAELAAVAAIKGHLPSPEEYLELAGNGSALDTEKQEIYRYLNFDQVDSFVEAADTVTISEEAKATAQQPVQ